MLGFGCMRFQTDPSTGEIDQEKVNAMFDLAVKGGVNYFDTAYPYLGGKSELAMAEALSRYPRESYYIADKFPGHSLTAPIDNIALFHVSLRKCRTDYFDFYLLHNITEWSEKYYESEEYHIIPDLLQMKEERKIRNLGFSFHGGPELLEKFLARHDGVFDFVQIQLNYLDWTLQDAKAQYEIIANPGLGVFVMEPCRGGRLAALPETESAKLRALYREEGDSGAFPGDASYAFRFLQGGGEDSYLLGQLGMIFLFLGESGFHIRQGFLQGGFRVFADAGLHDGGEGFLRLLQGFSQGEIQGFHQGFILSLLGQGILGGLQIFL